MYRRCVLRGCLLLGFGLGLLIGQCLDSWLLCTCGGCVLVVMAICTLLRKV